MEKINFLQDITYKDPNSVQGTDQEVYFPLTGYGYTLDEILNNKNRWYAKIVCHIQNNKDLRHYVSTTYAKHYDYLRLIETTTFLKCNNKLIPEIVKLYPRENTVVCKHIGEFLSEYLTNNTREVFQVLSAVFEYMEEINRIERRYKTFITPSIVRISLKLSDEFQNEFDFLPKTRVVLETLEKSDIKFLYGCGVEDPHIWNFRVRKFSGETQALTTDFDYFFNEVNCFWELGYFYATLRWLGKNGFYLRRKAEHILFTIVQKADLKSEFMFWLGVLSSYCGYRDSFCNSVINEQVTDPELEEQYKIIKFLDERVSRLAKKFL